MIERAERPRQRPRAHSRPARAPGLAAVLLAVSCAPAAPPGRDGQARSDLVEIATLDPGHPPRHPLRHRQTTSSAVPCTKEARAFLQRPAAEALVRAHRAPGRARATASWCSTATGPGP